MDEENKTTEQTEQNTPHETQAGAENANGAGAVSFDELLKQGHQAEFDRRVSKALATARANWEREQEENASEAKKLERMTAAQRERYQLDRDKAEFAKQQAAFAAQQMQVSVGAELQKRGLDAGFAKYLAGKTAEESSANLKTTGTNGGKDINFMIIQKYAAIQFEKHIAPKIITPQLNQTGDAWKFGYRNVGIADVYENKVAGIYLHHKA